MATKTEAEEEASEETRIIQWRMRCFLELGFSEKDAFQLACSDAYPGDVAKQLTRGMSRKQAIKILT